MRNSKKIAHSGKIVGEQLGKETPVKAGQLPLSNLTGYTLDGHEVNYRIVIFSNHGEGVCFMCLN